MTPKQVSILNALVTFAAENVPGGLSGDERVVAKIVGTWALTTQGWNHIHKTTQGWWLIHRQTWLLLTIAFLCVGLFCGFMLGLVVTS